MLLKNIKADVGHFMVKNGETAYMITIIPILAISVLSVLFEDYPVFSLLIAIIGSLVSVLISNAILSVYRGETFRFKEHFWNEVSEEGGRYVILGGLKSVYLTLWTMLFIVPGIIKQYAYSFSPYLLKDNIHMTPNESIKESNKMTHGLKSTIFRLHMRYLGWPSLLVVSATFAGTMAILTGFFGPAISMDSSVSAALILGFAYFLLNIVGLVFIVRGYPRYELALAALYEETLNENKEEDE